MHFPVWCSPYHTRSPSLGYSFLCFLKSGCDPPTPAPQEQEANESKQRPPWGPEMCTVKLLWLVQHSAGSNSEALSLPLPRRTLLRPHQAGGTNPRADAQSLCFLQAEWLENPCFQLRVSVVSKEAPHKPQLVQGSFQQYLKSWLPETSCFHRVNFFRLHFLMCVWGGGGGCCYHPLLTDRETEARTAGRRQGKCSLAPKLEPEWPS